MSTPSNETAAPVSIPPVQQIYNEMVGLFGGTNPNQFLTMSMPGTMLTPSDYAWDVTQSKPALVAEAESRLVDQMYDLAAITGAPNGQTVSNQYVQALSSLVPRFEPGVAAMKNKLRDFLTSAAPPSSTVDGKPFTGTLQELYFALYEQWLDKKSAWDTQVVEARETTHKGDPEGFLEWYEENAEGALAGIDAAEGKILAVLSPSDMGAILGALSSGPGGEIQESLDQVQDLRLPSPSGGYVYPVDLTPSDWFLSLASDLDPVNLLGDPQFIAITLSGRTQALTASISQVQALLAQVPSNEAVGRAAAQFTTAQTAYTAAQGSLMNTYTANTVTAVQMVMAAGGGEVEEGAKGLEALDQAVTSVSTAKKDESIETAAALADGSPLTPADFDKLVDGQKKAIAAQSGLLTSAQALSDAGLSLASQKAMQFGNLPVLLARLQSQLADVQTLQGQLVASVASPVTRQPVPVSTYAASESTQMTVVRSLLSPTDQPTPAAWSTTVYKALLVGSSLPADLQPIYMSALQAWAQPAADAAIAAAAEIGGLADRAKDAADETAAQDGATPQQVVDAVTAVLRAPAVSDDVRTACASLVPTAAATAAATSQAVDTAASTLQTAVAGIETAVSGALRGLQPTSTTVPPTYAAVPAAVTTNPVVTALGKITPSTPALTYVTAQTTAPDTAPSTLQAMTSGVRAVVAGYAAAGASAPTAKKSEADSRWMKVQMAFSSSDMESSSSQSSSASASQWSCDFFFGSAGSSSSSSSSSVSSSSFEADSQITVAFQATKVNVTRGWMNPGIFKLTPDLTRLTTKRVSWGSVTFDAAGKPTLPQNPNQDPNDALLPCFPVAFLLVKDVTMQFTVDESQLDAAQAVMDSRSASGGGCFCFSSSSSSSSSSDTSSMSSVSTSNTIQVTIPGPQILGWFLELTPLDSSIQLTDETPAPGQELSITQFVEQLRRYQDPSAPEAVDDVEPAGRHAL